MVQDLLTATFVEVWHVTKTDGSRVATARWRELPLWENALSASAP